MIDFLYEQNVWVMFLSVVSFFVTFSIIGLFLSIKLIPKSLRHSHAEYVSYGLATISIFSAVLLAFIAVTAWENYGKAEAVTSQEAQLTADVLRSSFVMPEPLRSAIGKSGNQYLDIVINEEWPSMANEQMEFRRGWDTLVDLYMEVSRFRTNDSILQIHYANLYEKINSLIDARRARILLAHQYFQPIVWSVVLITSIINIFYLFLFHMDSTKMHVVITLLISIAIGCIFSLIICFDRPFQGGLSIHSDAFKNVQKNYMTYKDKLIR